MEGYSPKLPLTIDPRDGFLLTKNLQEVVAQNLKMLILTSPGERVMVPTFGVGLYNYLFELNTQITRIEINERIVSQVKRYMPFVEIVQIGFGDTESSEIDRDMLTLIIKYRIVPLNVSAVLNIELS